ncbi:MAG: hypothetical protein AAFQ02_08045 [Bacteroidota bacterium]
MKTFFITFILSTCLTSITFLQAQDYYLIGVEQRIDDARAKGFESGSTSDLDAVIQQIQNTENLRNAHWVEYWSAYAIYQRSQVEAYRLQDEEMAKATTEQAITILKGLDNKNAEDYALMGLIKGYSLQWKSFTGMAKHSGIAGKWVKRAVEMDPQCPRTQYAFGNHDYYKPGIFGGGKKVESSLSTALALYKSTPPNPLLPTWGMDDSYVKLIRYRLKDDRPADALVLLEEALVRYPDHPGLIKIKKETSSL